MHPSLSVNDPDPLFSPKVGKTLTAEGNWGSSPLHRKSCHRQLYERSRRTVYYPMTVPCRLIAVYQAHLANAQAPDWK